MFVLLFTFLLTVKIKTNGRYRDITKIQFSSSDVNEAVYSSGNNTMASYSLTLF